MVTVFESQGMLGAQVAKSKLESAGIPALLKYESYGQVLGLIVDGLGRVEVQVPGDWVAEATAVLDDSDDASPTAANPGDDEQGPTSR